MSEANDILLKAAEILETKGWCQGAMQDSDGKCCALGAMELASKDLEKEAEDQCKAIQKLKIVCFQESFANFRLPSNSIILWNDKKDQTVEKVIEGFRKAIALPDSEFL